MGVFMKEIISFFVVSGGVGFFNLYLAQETDFLYFGKYNKEERLAWLSIFTIINYLLVNLFITTVKDLHDNLFILSSMAAQMIAVSFVSSFIFPIFVNWVINIVRKLLNKPSRTHLPPINTFFQDIEGYDLYAFDFNDQLINSGHIVQATEERQENLSVVLFPTNMDETAASYKDFINKLVEMRDELSFVEYTDYAQKCHLVKVKYL